MLTGRSIKLSEPLEAILKGYPLCIADVEAAYGIEPRWRSIRHLCRLHTFEPDERSQNLEADFNFPIGLAAKKEIRQLYLAAFPPASSIYPFNEPALKNFAVWDLHKVVGNVEIEVDALSDVIHDRPELKPDFIKVDVEGADFDVLVGAESLITSTVKGLQIEVAFIERHLGAATFLVVHTWMQERGFQLHMLAKEHWLTQNLKWGLTSQPQLVWGDAVYLLTENKMVKRLSSVEQGQQGVWMAKLLTISLAYGAHDYAQQILDSALQNGVMTNTDHEHFSAVISDNLTASLPRLINLSISMCLAVVPTLIALVITPIRPTAFAFFKRRIRDLAFHALQLSSKGGHKNICISEPFR